ncbi:cell division protein ZipA C-terminal FtsZ-binding domain-containing protein [Candidatus Synchoanobacter obligatus]|uniref:Cell division protein ZipA n=1 Tax=Candidatus Synchoanobacter obligatus TaxID=2919597 RepID=A0ABT1L4A4_9GAMM|nr:cell division protein ZipA C-terminal FtsZ-binding domain-containing protein [Candidatus Synchoanobacter obligatus]MCP8351992.1 hypothetical protein [Candidatus Synchoanobacter obligatus]
MIIQPIYMAAAVSGITLIAIIMKRLTSQHSDHEFIDIPQPTAKKNTLSLPELVTIYLIPEQPINGHELLKFFLSHRLQYNDYQIFDLPGPQHNQFSIATLSAPGTFDLNTMSEETFSGLSFFLQPRQSDTPLEDFDTLCRILFDAKDTFSGTLQSTNKTEITLEALRDLREKIHHEAT